jgi:localization factor PodJL
VAAYLPPRTEPAVDRTGEILEALAGNRTWLDERLADIAVRVEQSLAQFKPDTGADVLGARIDQLEERFMTALDGVSRRVDLDGLKQVEDHLAELTRYLEQSQEQLARLDGIEAQMQALTDFAAASQAEPAPVASTAAPAPELPDFAVLAEIAAERTALRLAAQTPAREAAPVDNRLDQLQAQFADFVAERRREDGHTASMLDTMQEALVRLIDRLDQLEPQTSHDEFSAAPVAPSHVTAPPAAAVAPPKPAAADAVVFVQDERGAAPGRRASDKPAAPPSALPVQQKSAPEPLFDDAEPTEAAAEREPAAAPEPALDVAGAKAAASRAAAAAAAKAAPRQRPMPTMTVAPEDETAKTGGVAKRGLMVAGVAALLVASGAFGLSFMGDRFRSPAQTAQPKLDDRVPMQKLAQPPRGSQLDTTEATGARPQPAAAQRPQNPETRPVIETSPAPAGAPRPRSVPETVTDDLSSNASSEPHGPTRAAHSAEAGTNGIAVQAASPVDLARQLQSARILTAPAGAVPAPQPAARPAAPLTTSSIKTADAPAADLASGAGSLADLPPATIGPVSLRHAAQKGDPAAQFEVASRFAEGKGVKQDFPQAIEWFQRSAQQGFVPSQYRLGTLFERGLSGKADIERAGLWYQRAAEQGNVKAMHNLAVLSAGRDGTPADYKTAGRWFQEAAERGLADSQFNLAVLHENGLGVAQDQIQAYKWFAVAARSGDKEAVKRRDQLMARFNPDEARLAEAAVNNWRARPVDLKANDARAAGEAWRAKLEQTAQAAAPVMPTPAAAAPAAPSGPVPVPDASAAKVRVHKGTPATPPVIR